MTENPEFAEWYKHCQANPLLKKKGIPECILFVTQVTLCISFHLQNNNHSLFSAVNQIPVTDRSVAEEFP